MNMDMTDWHVVVYEDHANGLLTTGMFLPARLAPDSEVKYIQDHFGAEIREHACESQDEPLIIVRQVDRFDVCVKGSFTPIGYLRVVAMMAPPSQKTP